MSTQLPAFATAPRIKLYINDQVVAYAIGFNINVSVDVQPVFVLGQYAPVSLEPTMYNIVSGTLQIVRLKHKDTLANQQKALSARSNSLYNDKEIASATAATNSNSNSEILTTEADKTKKTNSPLAQKELFKHLDPAQLLLSQSFNMDLYIKVPNASGTGLEETKWMSVQTCRIVSRNTNISMGQLVNEPLNFQGLLATHATPEFSLDNTTKQGILKQK